MKFHTFGFIGLGLIGGSLARAFRAQQPDCHIMAYTRSRKTTEEALEEKVINTICSSPSDPSFSKCDIIFLCAPVEHNISALSQLKNLIQDHCLLTDVGSVKTSIHEAVIQLGMERNFIGGHPMAGSEKTGFSSSNPHLFENAYYIITPSSKSREEDIEAYRQLAASIGSLPLVLDYKKHDYVTAAVSHLPHVIAVSLVNTVHDLDSRDELMKMIAAGGFKDITRIASSSPEMWEQICVENGQNISSVMDTFIALLEEARTNMLSKRGGEINRAFARSREYRNSFNNHTMHNIQKVYRIFCNIVDETGAIATIATLLAVNNINMKNIGIVHNREFEEGVLKIEFYDEKASLSAADILKQHRYQVWVR